MNEILLMIVIFVLFAPALIYRASSSYFINARNYSSFTEFLSSIVRNTVGIIMLHIGFTITIQLICTPFWGMKVNFIRKFIETMFSEGTTVEEKFMIGLIYYVWLLVTTLIYTILKIRYTNKDLSEENKSKFSNLTKIILNARNHSRSSPFYTFLSEIVRSQDERLYVFDTKSNILYSGFIKLVSDYNNRGNENEQIDLFLLDIIAYDVKDHFNTEKILYRNRKMLIKYDPQYMILLSEEQNEDIKSVGEKK
ncbi:hypothetical protein RI065_08545 [Mycoplasmatota bacterium zrk1]